MMIALAVFAGIAAVVLIPYFALVVRQEEASNRALAKRLKNDPVAAQVRAALVKEEERLSSLGFLNRILGSSKALVGPIQRLIDQAGYRFSPGRFILMTAVAFAVVCTGVTWRTGYLALGVVVGLVGGALPFGWMVQARKRRMNRFEEQFPEGIDLMARALRAGHTFQTGLGMVADEVPAPVGTEFRLLHEQQNFGMPIDEALRAFAERSQVLDAKFFATAVLTQRDAGGNLAEVLDNLSSVIRERFKVKRQVRAISAHGRITGVVLGGLPPALAMVFMVVSPKHMQTLFDDRLGIQMIMAAIVLQVTGTLIIKKIVNIEY